MENNTGINTQEVKFEDMDENVNSINTILNPNGIGEVLSKNMKEMASINLMHKKTLGNISGFFKDSKDAVDDDTAKGLIEITANALGVTVEKLVAECDVEMLDKVKLRDVLDSIELSEDFVDVTKKDENGDTVDPDDFKIQYLILIISSEATAKVFEQAQHEMDAISKEYEQELNAALASLDTLQSFTTNTTRKKELVPAIKALKEKVYGEEESTPQELGLLGDMERELKEINTEIGLFQNTILVDYLKDLVARAGRFKPALIKKYSDYKVNQSEKKKFISITKNCKEIIVISANQMHTTLTDIIGLKYDRELMLLMTLLYRDFSSRKEISKEKALLLNRLLVLTVRVYQHKHIKKDGVVKEVYTDSIFFKNMILVLDSLSEVF